MKLNYDCIRDLLLTLETNLEFDEYLEFNPISFDDLLKIEDLSEYSEQDLLYSIINLDDAGFIETVSFVYDGSPLQNISIIRITYCGHEFVETIRPKDIWQKTKTILSGIGTASLPLLSSVSSSLLNDAISPLIMNN